MKYKVYLDGNEIDSEYILNVTTSDLTFAFAGQKLISSKSTVILSNSEYRFDDRQNTNGFFVDYDWYNSTIIIQKEDENVKIFEGRLKNIDLNDNQKTVSLQCYDYIQDMVDTVCVINELGITVSEAIYKILNNPDYLAIPEDKIIKSDFDLAIGKQANQLINITFDIEDGKNCISVIEELCRISNSHIYIDEGTIGYWVWKEYNGSLGTSLENSDVESGSYSHSISDANIFTEYNIAYKSGDAFIFATGVSPMAINQFGSGKAFNVPNEELKTTNASEVKILYTTEAGAKEVGGSILQRYGSLKKTCNLTVKEVAIPYKLGDQVDFRFSPYIREPGIITKIRPDLNNNKFALEVELLNYPSIVDIDITAPDAVILYSIFSMNDKTYLIWQKSDASDSLGYRIYFTSSPNNWTNTNFSDQGIGFVDVKTPIETNDGNCFSYITGLDKGTTYYFRIVAYDNSFNMSDPSNVLSYNIPDMTVTGTEVQYMTQGNVLNSITLDMYNTLGGYLPNGFNHYDDFYYDQVNYEITAVYQSYIIHNPNGIATVEIVGNSSNIITQWRNYSNGSYGSWSSDIITNGRIIIDTQGNKYVQIRFIFKSPNWTDPDSIQITDIIEVE